MRASGGGACNDVSLTVVMDPTNSAIVSAIELTAHGSGTCTNPEVLWANGNGCTGDSDTNPGCHARASISVEQDTTYADGPMAFQGLAGRTYSWDSSTAELKHGVTAVASASTSCASEIAVDL